MAEPGGWAIEEYRTASGESPVRTFLQSLEKRDLADALALIKLAEERATSSGSPIPRRSAGDCANSAANRCGSSTRSARGVA